MSVYVLGLRLLLGFLAALIYATLGYVASSEDFKPKKFLRTLCLAILVALGLDVAGITTDVYTAMVGPLAILVWILKLIDSAQAKTK